MVYRPLKKHINAHKIEPFNYRLKNIRIHFYFFNIKMKFLNMLFPQNYVT